VYSSLHAHARMPTLHAQVAKLAVEGPVHKIEVRRARCFKDSVAVFAGKGHAVWRQPLKVRTVWGLRCVLLLSPIALVESDSWCRV